MTLIKHKIPAFLLAALIAVALTIAMGMTVQNAYADDTPAVGYEVYLEGVNDVCPGDTMNVQATVKVGGQTIDPQAEGKHIEWRIGVLGPEALDTLVKSDESSNNPDKHVFVGQDTTKAKVDFNPGSDVDTTLWIEAALMDGTTEVSTSDSAQFLLASEFNEIQYLNDQGTDFELDQYLFNGKTQDLTISVKHHKSGAATASMEVKYAWSMDNNGVQVLRNGNPVEAEETGTDVTFTFKRVDASKETETMVTVMDMDGNILDQICFPFYAASNNLADYQIEFNGTDGIMFFINKEDLPIDDQNNPACPITVVSGNGDGHVVPQDQYDLKIQKVLGYDETTWNNILQDTDFPLNVDPEGTMNLNGDRTDGTAIYVMKAVAKSGGDYTGQTAEDTGILWLLDRKTLTWPAADVGFTGNCFNEDQSRYEAKIGTKLTPFAKSNDTEKNLTLNKEYSVKYVNNKTTKATNSFPTTAGLYTVVFAGIKPYYGTVDSIQLLVGKKNTIKAKGKTIVYKAKLKKKKTKKTKSFKAAKAVKVTKAKGTVTYSKVSGNAKITVADNGKVTVKKGLKKGTYKIKVKVTADGTDTYLAGSKTVKVKIKVK